jgi:hypothetical protein
MRGATALLSLLFALVLAEVGLRILAPSRTRHYVWPPNVHHTFRPRPDIFPGAPPETHFTINKLGLRGPDLGKDGEETRVLTVGGSTTECLFQDDTKTWSARLGDLLTASAGRRVWVGNAGLSGMRSGDHVLHAKHLLAELPRIDVMIVLAGVNDVSTALGSPADYAAVPEDIDDETHEKAVRRAFQQVPGRLENSWDYHASFLRRSQLFQLVRRARRRSSNDLSAYYLAQDDTGSVIERWRENRRKAAHVLAELPDLAPFLATFRANLKTISVIARKHGTRLVLMTQPVLWRAGLGEAEERLLWMGGVGEFMREPGHDYYSAEALGEAMRRFNAVTLDVCREEGLTCVDLASQIPADTSVFYDDCHFGWQGSEKIAQAAAAKVAAEAPFAAR